MQRWHIASIPSIVLLCCLAVDGHAPSASNPADTEEESLYCIDWASGGECERNPEYMLQACAKACATSPAATVPSRLMGDASSVVAPTSGSTSAVSTDLSASNIAKVVEAAELQLAEALANKSLCEEAATRCDEERVRLTQNCCECTAKGDTAGVLERCTMQNEKCEADKVRLKQQVHDKEQRQWDRAEAAIAREQKAMERLEKCFAEADEKIKQDRQLAAEELRARLDEQEKSLKEEQRERMSKAAKVSQKREFQFYEAARDAKNKLELSEERLAQAKSGVRCEDAERRAKALAEEAQEAESLRTKLEAAHLQHLRESKERERDLQEKLRATEHSLSVALSELAEAQTRTEQLRLLLDEKFDQTGASSEPAKLSNASNSSMATFAETDGPTIVTTTTEMPTTRCTNDTCHDH